MCWRRSRMSKQKLEKQKALSLPFHIALESSQKPRVSHNPTAPAAAANFPFSRKTSNFNFDESVTYMPLPFVTDIPGRTQTLLRKRQASAR
jgi:hypothetical protein